MVIALRLAKAGYWGGDPEKVLSAPADMVISAMQYEMYQQEYERTWVELNKENA
jgi:hypothetical protein